MRLSLGEPEACDWHAVPLSQLVDQLISHAGGALQDRSRIVAIDGRGGAGKSVLARRLATRVARSAVVATDDIAWHQASFDWGALLRENVFLPLRCGAPVSFRPPAWGRHGRAGRIEVSAGLSVV